MVIAKDKVSYWLWEIRFYLSFIFGIEEHKTNECIERNSSGEYLLVTDKFQLKCCTVEILLMMSHGEG